LPLACHGGIFSDVRKSTLDPVVGDTMRRPFAVVALALIVMLTVPVPTLQAQPTADDSTLTRLLRYPDIHRDRIAFVYAGDIWIVPTTGGLARRLTSHEGMELYPKFSPDGRWIAFSGEYDGTRQVYVMPGEGGTPTQLTFYNDVGPMPPRGGTDYRIYGWTPDGSHVVFRANRLPWGVRVGRPFQVPVTGGLETPLAIPESGGADLSPDGTQVVFTPMDREFRTWKRYRGGRAQDVWVYDLEANTARQITDAPATDNQPVWVDETVYFTSDRDWKLNLYAVGPQGGEAAKVTFHEDYDVLWPSGGPGGVVYENGGWIWRFDPSSRETTKVPIRVAGDLPFTRPTLKDVSDGIQSSAISPSGARALFEARGELFTVPAEHGQLRNITRSQGVREMDPSWSPDGKWIAYLSDRSGEYEIYVRAQDGSDDERRITTDGEVWRFPPVWSPDSKRLAFGDKRQRLQVVDVENGRITDVDRSETNDITDFAWSPDSKWIAYRKTADTRLAQIWVWSLDGGDPAPLTDPMVASYSPAFDPEGRYLYFLSNRDMNLTFSGWEAYFVYTGPTRVYAATLNADEPRPFQPRSDEEEPDGGAEEDESDNGNDDGEKNGDGDEDEVEVRIDVEGFETRVVAIPGPSGRYGNLEGTAKGPVYTFAPTGGDTPPALKRYLLEDREEETILKGIGNIRISADRKKVLYSANGKWAIAELSADQTVGDKPLDLSGMQVTIDPQAEWEQMYTDAWRITRDWFYDPNLHGVDWELMRERYGALVPHVAHRRDLDYVLGELGGELNVGHLYVQSGDEPVVERQDHGLLGAELEADPSGRYRIVKIFRGENWHDGFRSPLTEPGVDVNEGDLLLAIDGHEITTADNPYRPLQGRAGQPVTLTVGSDADGKGSRDVQVRPIARETNLRYLDWVEDRRRRVSEASDGRIGYMHLPNTAVEGNRELFRNFYPQSDFDALILDERYNGGGFIPVEMIELLSRPVLSYWARRGITPMRSPGFAHTGPKAMLINGLAASGGDALPFYFRQQELGTLIGTRTWGGLVGLSGTPSLADGGAMLTPTFRFFVDGRWEVENEGVAPDIEVVDRPDLVAQGRDPSLEKAIEVLLEELRRDPPVPVQQPAPWVDPYADGP
jgi:tricorn protease